MDNRYNRHNRRKYSLKVDIVLVTKYRKQLLKDSIADDVNDIANTYGTNMVRFCLNSIGRKKYFGDRKSTRLNSSHWNKSRMPSSA